MKVRKKPVTVDAVRFEMVGQGDQLIISAGLPADWLAKAFVEDTLIIMDHGSRGGRQLYIRTLEGPLHVSNGDWIIKGTKGELYPCKPDVFEEVYEVLS